MKATLLLYGKSYRQSEPQRAQQITGGDSVWQSVQLPKSLFLFRVYWVKEHGFIVKVNEDGKNSKEILRSWKDVELWLLLINHCFIKAEMSLPIIRIPEFLLILKLILILPVSFETVGIWQHVQAFPCIFWFIVEEHKICCSYNLPSLTFVKHSEQLCFSWHTSS